MDKYEQFQDQINKASQVFKQIDKSEVIRVVSHLDADGISSAAILVKTLSRDNRRYSLSTVHQLDERVIKEISREPYSYVLFSDLGSGQFNLIKKYLPDKKIIIFDHHQLQDVYEAENITHVNPHICGINGSTEISGSGVVYTFAKTMNKRNIDLAHIGLIGALGDMQEGKQFERLNLQIVKDGQESGRIKVITGLRFFGAQTRPLHKIMERSTEFQIPGITGNESGAIMFLQQLGINPRKNNDWKKLIDLTEDEMQKLATAIILRRLDEQSPEAIVGPVYILTGEEKESPFRDAKEFSTLLNACGRLGKASLGIGACLGNPAIKEKAIKALTSYKREISNAMNWYKNTGSGIIKGKGYMIINAQDNIMPTIVGTVASIISRSGEIEDGMLILSMAQMINEKTKVSLRISNLANKKNGVNLREIIGKIAESVDGQAGGHHEAAGAIIDTEKEAEFLETSMRILESQTIEQKIA